MQKLNSFDPVFGIYKCCEHKVQLADSLITKRGITR